MPGGINKDNSHKQVASVVNDRVYHLRCFQPLHHTTDEELCMKNIQILYDVLRNIKLYLKKKKSNWFQIIKYKSAFFSLLYKKFNAIKNH